MVSYHLTVLPPILSNFFKPAEIMLYYLSMALYKADL